MGLLKKKSELMGSLNLPIIAFYLRKPIHKHQILFLYIERYLKWWNIPKDLALDSSAWKITIHMPEPWLLLLGFNFRLQPTYLGLKGFIVIVVYIERYLQKSTETQRK